jgi:D-arabinose 5-phosphate isomerase GutQ
MMTAGLTELTATGRTYLEFLNEVLITTEKEYPQIEHLIRMIQGAKAVHIFGFGRSGAAAVAFAIRLRHFGNYLPPVWWAGDQMRRPILKGDVVILFSGSGTRPEVEIVACKAKAASAHLILITAAKKSTISDKSDLVIVLPKIHDMRVFGGGDFELGAFFLQEILVAYIGKMSGIPIDEIEKNHV